jgi:protein farnesyltransferase subunit beta
MALMGRDKMYEFFISLKQPYGSFLMMRHAEVDVRSVLVLYGISGL